MFGQFNGVYLLFRDIKQLRKSAVTGGWCCRVIIFVLHCKLISSRREIVIVKWMFKSTHWIVMVSSSSLSMGWWWWLVRQRRAREVGTGCLKAAEESISKHPGQFRPFKRISIVFGYQRIRRGRRGSCHT